MACGTKLLLVGINKIIIYNIITCAIDFPLYHVILIQLAVIRNHLAMEELVAKDVCVV